METLERICAMVCVTIVTVCVVLVIAGCNPPTELPPQDETTTTTAPDLEVDVFYGPVHD